MRGFTLIETIIYIALLALIMGGAVFTAYNIIQSEGHLSSNAVLQEEGNFVLRKIDWALSGVQSITFPAPGAWGDHLSLTRFDSATPVNICFTRQTIWMREGGSGGICGDTSYASTTTSNVTVSTFSFHHIPASGTSPEGLEASTTINGYVFSTTRYFRN